jgi:hypothetical protein
LYQNLDIYFNTYLKITNCPIFCVWNVWYGNGESRDWDILGRDVLCLGLFVMSLFERWDNYWGHSVTGLLRVHFNV